MRTPLILVLALTFSIGRATADDAVVRYEAVEAWRTVDDDSAPYLFGVVSRIVADSRGRVFVLDRQLQEIHRFSADGVYETLVCRAGEGPGELSNVFWFGIDSEDRLVIQRNFPPGVERVDGDGTFIDSITFEGPDGEPPFTFLGSGLAATEAGFVVGGMILDMTNPRGARQRVAATFGPDGKWIAEIGRMEQPQIDFQAVRVTIDERERFFPAGRRAVSPDGRLYVAPEWDRYRIVVMDMKGNVLDTIERDVVARRRTAEELEEAKKSYAFSRGDGGPMPEFDFELAPTVQPIGGLDFRDGMLWVRVDAPDLAEDGFGRFDVYSPGGDFVETREINLPDVEDGDLTQWLDGTRLVVLENFLAASRAANAGVAIKVGNDDVAASEDDDGAMNVVVYDLVRR